MATAAPSCGLSYRKPEKGKTLWTDVQVEALAEKKGVLKRPQEIKGEIDERGAFVRQRNRFDTPFGDGEGELTAESGRYKLLWAKLCHWSNRASIVRELLGLEDAISVGIVEHTGETNQYGWGFSNDPNHEDPELHVNFLSELYLNADPDYKGRCTVPSFVDKQTKKVVNNDYHRLTNYLEVAFRPWQAEDAPDLYPEELRKEIDEFNDWLFPNINNAHYRMAFCQSLEAYKEAYDDFYAAMNTLEERLSKKRFLFGDYVTDSDIRFYVTLVRWDTHYYRNLGPLTKRVKDFKNIWDYVRDLYVIPAFKNNTYFRDFAGEQNNGELFASFNARFVDKIDFESIFSEPTDRAKLSKTPEEKFRRHGAKS